tara:strand:- start:642 stop:827 length:186 start_codon:yes stop_codon:yes gene_type:complete
MWQTAFLNELKKLAGGLPGLAEASINTTKAIAGRTARLKLPKNTATTQSKAITTSQKIPKG